MLDLKTLSGTAFDKAYVDQEVAYHQQVLDALDKILIPNATNGELKALLVKVRPAFVAHLEHAKHLQKSTDGASVMVASRTLGIAGALVCAVVLASCAESEGKPDRPLAKTHIVIMEGMVFQPAVITVTQGDTIVWVNKDMVPHSATSEAAGIDSKALAAGASYRFTVKAKGATDYACLFHPTMTGRIDAE